VSPDSAHRRWTRLIPIGIVLGTLAFFAGLLGAGRHPARAVHPLTGRQIAGIATDAQWMDRSPREQEEQPEKALDLIGVSPGTVVADVGAGSGYMTLRLANRVGPSGQVYANDLQPALLHIVEDKAGRARLANVKTVLGTEEDARLPEHAIDLVLLVDVYHEFSRPEPMLQSLRRALKPDGRLVLVEYRKEDPAIPIAATHRMSVADARTEIEAEGFRFEKTIEALPRQHIIIFRLAAGVSEAPSRGDTPPTAR
jgi:ubiquinone/menaquinone biosynthesis C-methylase UbiE